jgi:hypothetical protein
LSKCLLKQQLSQISFSRDCAPNTNIWQMQRIFMQRYGVQAQHILLFWLLLYRIKWDCALSIIFFSIHNPLLLRKKLSNTQLPRKWQTTKLKHDGQPVLNDSVERADLIYVATEAWNNSVNVGIIHWKGKGRRAASYNPSHIPVFISAFIQAWYLGCVLYGTLYKNQPTLRQLARNTIVMCNKNFWIHIQY